MLTHASGLVVVTLGMLVLGVGFGGQPQDELVVVLRSGAQVRVFNAYLQSGIPDPITSLVVNDSDGLSYRVNVSDLTEIEVTGAWPSPVPTVTAPLRGVIHRHNGAPIDARGAKGRILFNCVIGWERQGRDGARRSFCGMEEVARVRFSTNGAHSPSVRSSAPPPERQQRGWIEKGGFIRVNQMWTSVADLQPGDRVSLRFQGGAAFDTDGGTASPSGSGRGPASNASLLPGAPRHSVVCKLGIDGAVFFAGDERVVVADRAGALMCGMNEDPALPSSYSDNSGIWSYTLVNQGV